MWNSKYSVAVALSFLVGLRTYQHPSIIGNPEMTSLSQISSHRAKNVNSSATGTNLPFTTLFRQRIILSISKFSNLMKINMTTEAWLRATGNTAVDLGKQQHVLLSSCGFMNEICHPHYVLQTSQIWNWTPMIKILSFKYRTIDRLQWYQPVVTWCWQKPFKRAIFSCKVAEVSNTDSGRMTVMEVWLSIASLTHILYTMLL